NRRPANHGRRLALRNQGYRQPPSAHCQGVRIDYQPGAGHYHDVGSAGGHSWSATGLPAWLNLSAAGALTGTPPLTAINATFTVKVTDSSNDSTSGSFTVPVTLAITTTSQLPTGQVGVNYSQTLTAIGGSGLYTWAVSVGSSLPGGLLLNSVTGLIGGPPTTAAASNFTIQATDSSQATA